MPKRKGNHPGCWVVHERQAGLPVDLVLRLLVWVAVAKVSSTWFGTTVRFLRNPPWPPDSTHISAWSWCSLGMHGIFEIRFMYSEMHSCQVVQILQLRVLTHVDTPSVTHSPVEAWIISIIPESSLLPFLSKSIPSPHFSLPPLGMTFLISITVYQIRGPGFLKTYRFA